MTAERNQKLMSLFLGKMLDELRVSHFDRLFGQAGALDGLLKILPRGPKLRKGAG